MNQKAISLDELSMMVCAAVDRLAQLSGQWCYAVEVYADSAIIEMGLGQYYRAPYAVGEGNLVVIAPREEWTQVEKEWSEVKRLETLVAFGDPVKALGEGRVGGYLVRFGSPEQRDLTGEYFTAKTWYGERDGDGAYALFHHGQPLKSGLEVLADHWFAPLKTKRDEIGIWAETVLNLADAYERAVYDLIAQGKLEWSSGTAPSLMKKSADGEILRWPIVEGSFTPTPAEWRNRVVPLKSLVSFTAAPASAPEATPEASATAGAGRGAAQDAAVPTKTESNRPTIFVKEVTVTDQTPQAPQAPAQDDALKAFEERMQKMSERMEKALKLIEDSPAIKSAGYVTVDGGAADPTVKSLGDFLVAVKRGDVTRLQKVYESTKAMTEEDGTAGGYLVPPGYSADLLKIAQQTSRILARIARIPVNTPAGTWPSLDQFVAPTAGAGNTALAGGVKATKRAEGGAYTETNPAFNPITWRVHSVGGYVKVSDELAADSPIALEMLLRDLFGIAIAAKEEYFVLRGTGVGEPLGILNAPCLVQVSPDTNSVFAYEDALEMLSRFKSAGGQMSWLINQSVLPDIGTFRIGTGSPAGVPLPFLGSPTLGNTMPGVGGEYITTEHLPQADNSGCVILADLNAYKLWVRGGLAVAYSEHADFENGNVMWRFGERLDGQPWLKSYITLADPQGSFTVSPFVSFND